MSEPIHVQVQGGTPPPRQGGGGSIGLLMLIPGMFFITLGVLVFVWPALLQIMVAAAFILVGIGLCLGGLRMRRVGQQFTAFTQQFPPR